MGEGRKSITLLEDSQALPTLPYGSSSMKMELFPDTFKYKGYMASD